MIIIDKGKCILCGVCEGLAPNIFQQTTSVSVDIEAAKQELHYTYLCIEACPTEAIKLTEGM